jgi:hypothetical protein
MSLSRYRDSSNYRVGPIYDKYVGVCFNYLKNNSIDPEKIFNFSYPQDKNCFICNDVLHYISIPFNFGMELKIDLINGN